MRMPVLMVVNAAQAAAVLFDGGALAALAAASAVVVLMATCAPADAAGIGEEVAGGRAPLLDAPVSGGVVGATGGTLTIMAAAPKRGVRGGAAAVDGARRQALPRRRAPGPGRDRQDRQPAPLRRPHRGAAEAFTLAGRPAIDRRGLLEIISGSAADELDVGDRGPRMIEDEPAGRRARSTSSSRTSASCSTPAAPAKAALPLAAAAHQMFLAASGLGHGAADDSQVMRAYRALNEEPLSRAGEG